MSFDQTMECLLLLGYIQLNKPRAGLLLRVMACSIVSGRPIPAVSGKNIARLPSMIVVIPINTFGAGFQ